MTDSYTTAEWLLIASAILQLLIWIRLHRVSTATYDIGARIAQILERIEISVNTTQETLSVHSDKLDDLVERIHDNFDTESERTDRHHGLEPL